ncbi:MAG: tRNA (adenosine(37)-N6)-methyltransferase TrmM [Odoribacter sp.]|nr:tRNA (adenosine(37)-N6)-methyltransferase TrmM [Odoribacter sp.]
MSKNYFRFKQFTINQEKAVFKVGTDGVLLGALADLSGAKRILDVGTGTGLIAIMTAQRSNASIVAIEMEIMSYRQACENVEESKWKARIELINKGFIEYAGASGEKFDIIISNPPYFRDSLKNPDATRSAARHSEFLSSSDILKGTAKLLNQTGSLQLILPYAEGTLFIAEACEYGLFCNCIIKIKPVPTGEIIRLILKFERTKKPVSEKFLTIETATRHRYTDEYKEVTKDFYINF